MKILYITPHLSTGGLPQYLLKQIECFSKDFEIYCIEWENITGNILIVQRSKIQNLLKEKMFTLSENKQECLSIIERIKPSIIHFQEIPESFIQKEILNKIYTPDRNFNIIVTTHSSYTDPSRIKYTADKFVLVSEWSTKQFKKYFQDSVPCETWEYPIEEAVFDKQSSKKELGFNLNKKHVLHVGLFTHGKNQKHILEVAKKCLDENIEFHFVGNQSENFRDYWEPLMKDWPKNCVWHGERSDVDKFYRAADLFYFPSLFELSPISIKEAIAHKLHLFLTKLDTYENTYDKCATYIDENIDQCVDKLLSFFDFKKSVKPPILHILTDIDAEREVKSMQSLTKLSDFGYNYVPIISKRYTEYPPKESCKYPEKISLEPNGKLTPAHYGCYLGHKKAFEKGLEINSEYMLIFECDAVIDISYENFLKKIEFAMAKIKKDDLLLFSFGFHNHSNIINKKEDYWIVNAIYGAHAYLIPKKSYSIIKNIYDKEKWNVADLFFNDNFSSFKIGIFEKPITKQTAGYSILDKIYNYDRY